MTRLLAVIFFVAGLGAGGLDLLTAANMGVDVKFQSIGDHWFLLHPDSLMGMHPMLAQVGLLDFAYEILFLPAAPTFLIVAFVLWVVGGFFRRRSAAPPRPGKVATAKNSTRARRNADTQLSGMHRAPHTASDGPVRRMR